MRMEMRIAYVLASLGIGGAERQVVALAERMAKRGHAVALLVLLPRLPEEWSTSVEAVHLNMRKTPASLLRAIIGGRRFLRAFHPDLVHSHGFHGNLMARLFRLLNCAPLVLSTLHNDGERSRIRMLAYRLTDGLSRRTTAVCEAAALAYVRVNAVPKEKCTVVTNGIDTVEFGPDPERRARVRAQLNAGGAFVWLAAGRIVPAKDFPNLLRAFAQVQAAQPSTRLWIAGEAEALKHEVVSALAVELGVADAVHWLGLRRDLPALLDAADGFVLGSAWEGMPLAVGEAMAMGKIVAATDVGGMRELLGAAGAMAPAKDPAALAQAMLGLMSKSPEERRALGCAARERIIQSFSMDAKADEWEALYRSLLASGA
jgi:glycosyltransferase involved in cell wall biosynthesis